MSTAANPTDAARYISAGLHRTPPDTGIIRSELVGPHRIRDVMAADIRRIIGDRGADAVITDRELIALGWTRAQVHEHGQAAISQLEAAESPDAASDALAAQIAALAEIAATARSIAARVERDIVDLQRRYGRPA
ncbi:hypothetical protein [Blastochloris tepida]|uniref:Uncharacterized protein n=1 Tax=Blastochloris tepida TaxID=2233851 RepID=A0A348G1B5_9HYPH|nr:hypothetical protein [Blastochloris tepida]BBF93348.1 hypothetical protein BLTE_20330 [Blastochloris tepida]